MNVMLTLMYLSAMENPSFWYRPEPGAGECTMIRHFVAATPCGTILFFGRGGSLTLRLSDFGHTKETNT